MKAEFGVQSASSAGIGASDPISLVSVGIRHNNLGTASGAWSEIQARLKSASNGTALVNPGVIRDYYNTGWRTNGAVNGPYGEIVDFDLNKITSAVRKAYAATGARISEENLGRLRSREAAEALRPLVEAKQLWRWANPPELRLVAAQEEADEKTVN